MNFCVSCWTSWGHVQKIWVWCWVPMLRLCRSCPIFWISKTSSDRETPDVWVVTRGAISSAWHAEKDMFKILWETTMLQTIFVEETIKLQWPSKWVFWGSKCTSTFLEMGYLYGTYINIILYIVFLHVIRHVIWVHACQATGFGPFLFSSKRFRVSYLFQNKGLR